MPYSDEFVRQVAHSCSPEVAKYVGNSESSVYGGHLAAIDLWERALALAGDEALNPSERAFAEAELARHRAAIEAPPPGRKRSEVV